MTTSRPCLAAPAIGRSCSTTDGDLSTSTASASARPLSPAVIEDAYLGRGDYTAQAVLTPGRMALAAVGTRTP